MGKNNRVALALTVLGMAGMLAVIRMPDHSNWWVLVWILSLQAIVIASIIYYLGLRRKAEEEEGIEIGARTPEQRLARIASTAVETPLDMLDAKLSTEHRASKGYWDAYQRSYVLECECGYQSKAEALEEAGKAMDTHHRAFVRFIASLRKVHELSNLPGGVGDGLDGVGSQMDEDWRVLSPTQRREVERLSTEIAWRLETKIPPKFSPMPVKVPLVPGQVPLVPVKIPLVVVSEGMADIEPTTVSTQAVDNPQLSGTVS